MVTQVGNINISFKGYDARHLQGLAMSSNFHGIASEMFKIAKKEHFDLFFYDETKRVVDKFGEKSICYEFKDGWIQDIVSIIKDNYTCRNLDAGKAFGEYFNLYPNKRQSALRNCILKRNVESFLCSSHIEGGNFFLAKNAQGEEVALIGQNDFNRFLPSTLKQIFGTHNICSVPQRDFHLDLFIRPLDKGRVLLTDDNLSLDMFSEGIDKIKAQLFRTNFFSVIKRFNLISLLSALKEQKKQFEKEISKNCYSSVNRVDTMLQDVGFETQRVPGRIYNTEVASCGRRQVGLSHIQNFMNANVLLNSNNELIYITNGTLLDSKLGITPKLQDEIDFGFERSFVKALAPYVKKEHIHFVRGKNNVIPDLLLPHLKGGIHCLCTEIPNKNNNI